MNETRESWWIIEIIESFILLRTLSFAVSCTLNTTVTQEICVRLCWWGKKYFLLWFRFSRKKKGGEWCVGGWVSQFFGYQRRKIALIMIPIHNGNGISINCKYFTTKIPLSHHRHLWKRLKKTICNFTKKNSIVSKIIGRDRRGWIWFIKLMVSNCSEE